MFGCQSTLELRKQPTKEDIVSLINSSNEFELLTRTLDKQRLRINSKISTLSKEQRINLKKALHQNKIDPSNQTEIMALKIAEIDNTIVSFDEVLSLYASIYNKLVSSGANHDLIKRSWEYIEFSLNSKNSSQRTTRSEYQHCINQSYYYLSLAVMDCLAGPSNNQNWCVGMAERYHIIYMLNCIADCSMENDQVCY